MKKIINKLTALLILTLLAVNASVIPVWAAADPANMYLCDRLVFEDDFEDGTVTRMDAQDISEHTYKSGGEVLPLPDSAYQITEAGGALNVAYNHTTYASTGFNSFYSLADEDGAALNDGIYVVSFKLKKTNGKRMLLGFENASQSGSLLYWKENGNIDFPSNNNTVANITDKAEGFHNVFFVFENYTGDENKPYIKLYIDNELLYSDYMTKEQNISKLRIQHHSSYGWGGTFSFDDMKVYKAIVNPRALDAETVTLESLLGEALVEKDGGAVLTTDLNTLPTLGASGSVISWTSSNPDIISNTGKVTRPENGYPLSEKVTLTAHFEWYDEIGDTFDKDFDFYVKRADKAPAEYMDGDYLLYDDFSGNKLSGAGWESSSERGNISFEDDSLKITNTGTGNNYYYTYQFNKDGSVYANGSGSYILEFDLKKDFVSGDIQTWVVHNVASGGGINSAYVSNQIMDHAINYPSGSKKPSAAVNPDRLDYFNIRYHLDTDNHLYSLWIDDAPVVINAKNTSNKNNLYGIAFFVNKSGSTAWSINIDNLKLYKVTDEFDPEAPVSSFKITNDTEAKTKIDNPGIYRLSVTKQIEDGASVPRMIFALYSAGGKKLEAVKFASASRLTANAEMTDTATGESIEEHYGYYYTNSVTVPEEYTDCVIKAFTWDSASSLKPVDDGVVITAQ